MLKRKSIFLVWVRLSSNNTNPYIEPSYSEGRNRRCIREPISPAPVSVLDVVFLQGLTEPNHGSDPAGMETTAEEVDGGFIINGSKTWISNAPVA